MTDELVDVLLTPLLSPGAADVVFDTLSYSAGKSRHVHGMCRVVCACMCMCTCMCVGKASLRGVCMDGLMLGDALLLGRPATRAAA